MKYAAGSAFRQALEERIKDSFGEQDPQCPFEVCGSNLQLIIRGLLVYPKGTFCKSSPGT
jgi:hypothetical protein